MKTDAFASICRIGVDMPWIEIYSSYNVEKNLLNFRSYVPERYVLAVMSRITQITSREYEDAKDNQDRYHLAIPVANDYFALIEDPKNKLKDYDTDPKESEISKKILEFTEALEVKLGVKNK